MKRLALEDKVWDKVKIPVNIMSECWGWNGTKSSAGYGQINHGGKSLKAHRVAWRLLMGEIPTGLHVLHSCDNPPCLNPAHLFLGTHADNMLDRDLKHRQTRGEACRKGLLTEDIVRQARDLHRREHRSIAQLARAYGIKRGTMYDAVEGFTWAHVHT